MTDLLNVMGKQTVASLQMTVGKADGEPGESHDERSGVRLDVDFSPPDEFEKGYQNGYKTPHLFGQNVVTREGEGNDGRDTADHVEDVIQRRHAQQSVTRRYVTTQTKQSPLCSSRIPHAPNRYRTTLRYPLPDSFPHIYRDTLGNDLPGPASVAAGLSTDSSVFGRLRLLRNNVARSIGLEDRETLSNDLAEMADEYHDGWSSGSDEGDDE